MNASKLFQISTMLSAVLLVMGFFYTALSSQSDTSGLCADGRLNCEAWQTGAVYCDETAIRVLYSRSDDARQGQIALYVAATEISAFTPKVGEAVLIEENAEGFSLHLLENGFIQFSAPGLQADTPYEFRFSYPQCEGQRLSVDSVSGEQSIILPGIVPTEVDTVTPGGPTLTPSDTPTVIPTSTPSDTPTSTATEFPTDTPIPTDTPTSTATEVPTETALP